MSKIILFGKEGRKKILKGIETVAKSVRVTLGPKGKNVMIGKGFGTAIITKDGVSIASNITVPDLFENEGAKYIREIANKTNVECGDGTTTSTVLAYEMLKYAYEKMDDKTNPISVKKGIDLAVNHVVEQLRKNSIPIETHADIANIGTISANGDESIGKVLADAMEEVGRDGLISIENSTSVETSLEIVKGMSIEDRGYISPYFATNEKMEAVLEKPYILVYDKPIQKLDDIRGILEIISEHRVPLLIISDGVQGEALSTIVLNKMKGRLNICAVPAPSFGVEKHDMLEDLAILTGGTFISDEMGMHLNNVTIEQLGRCEKAVVTKDNTMIIGGLGDKEELDKRIETIQYRINNTPHDLEKEKLQRRLAKLVGGVAIVKIGAYSDTELKEKHDRAIDALHSTKSAVQEGVLVGGGSAFLHVMDSLDLLVPDNKDELLGIEIIKYAIARPFHQILKNIGYGSEYIGQEIQIIKHNGIEYGFNAYTDESCNMLDEGIIDPTKVVINSLRNSSSVMSTLLTTEVFMVEDLKEGEDMRLPKMPNVPQM